MSTSASGSSKNSSNNTGGKRRSRPLLRVVTSAVLAGVVLYAVWQRGGFRSATKTLAAKRSAVSGKPLKTFSPSADSATAFAWVPRYPGAVTENITSSVNRDRVSYGFHFRVPLPEKPSPDTKAPNAETVRTYYETQLRTAGFTHVEKSVAANNNDSGLHAESSDGKRILDLLVTGTATNIQANVAAIEK